MIVTWSQGDANYNMDENILVRLGDLISCHPWWHARARLAVALLQRFETPQSARILDVGCGWGSNLVALEKTGYEVVGLDISRQALERLDQPSRRLIECDITKPLPHDAEEYDVALALDVIEHLDDDAAAVKILGRLVKPGGLVIVSVPALPDLYSDYDKVQGHRQRYLPETLRKAFECSDLAIKQMLWWGAWMVPILRRQRGQVKTVSTESPSETYQRYLSLPPWPAPLLMQLAFQMEQNRTLQGKTQIGTSLFAIAQRNQL